MLTRDQAGAAVKAAVAERDAIQANLLELDSSFGKQLLAGAELTGDTKRRWDATAAVLATLWQVYSAYSAVVDQAAEAAARHLGTRELAALSALLTGRSVQLASGPAPLAGRDLADSGREDLTLATAVARMRGAFGTVTEVVAAAEQVWTEVAGRLDAAGTELARVTSLAATLGDEALTGNLAAVQGKLARLRDTLNSDPLALWLGHPGPSRPGQGRAAVDTSGADRLHEEVAAAAAQVDELVRVRDGARQRIAGVTAAAATARSLILREDRLVFGHQSKSFVIAAEIVEIVSKVDHSLAVIRELLNHFIAKLRRFSVFSLECEVPFPLALDLRACVRLGRGPFEPLLSQIDVVSFDRSVRSPGDDESIVRHVLVGAFVVCLRGLEFSLRGI